MRRKPASFPTLFELGTTYWIGERKFQLGSSQIRALQMVAKILRSQRPSVYWLVRHRKQIRRIREIAPRAALTRLIMETEDVDARRFAIWLRGQCGGKLGARFIASFAHEPDPVARKHTIHCLKQLAGWAELQQIAVSCRYPETRQQALQAPPPPFEKRLRNFVEHVAAYHTERGAGGELFVNEDVDISRRKPTKPRWWIRRILGQIQRVISLERNRRAKAGQG